MKRLGYLIVLLTFVFPSTSLAQNEDIWNAFSNANLPLAMELIEKHRGALDVLYHPNGETRTILSFLQRYDLIRTPETITEAMNDDFVEVITGDRPVDWEIVVDDGPDEQKRELIKRFCGRRSIWGHSEDGYIIHAQEDQVLSLAENCMWVRLAVGL